MYSIQKFLSFTCLLFGTYDGRQVVSNPMKRTAHYVAYYVFLFETCKALMLLFTPPAFQSKFDMHLIEPRLSNGNLRKLSSLFVALLSFSFLPTYLCFRSYNNNPSAINFMQPLHPHLVADPVFRLSSDRQRLFARLVLVVNSLFTINHTLLTLTLPILILSYTWTAYFHVPLLSFFTLTLPSTLNTTAASFFDLSNACFIIQIVALFFLFLVFRLRDEQIKLSLLVKYSPANEYSTRFFLTGFNSLLQQLHLFDQFLQNSCSHYFLTIFVLISVLPYMVLFDNNPFVSRLAIAFVYFFHLILLVAPFCMMNSIIYVQVMSNTC